MNASGFTVVGVNVIGLAFAMIHAFIVGTAHHPSCWALFMGSPHKMPESNGVTLQVVNLGIGPGYKHGQYPHFPLEKNIFRKGVCGVGFNYCIIQPDDSPKMVGLYCECIPHDPPCDLGQRTHLILLICERMIVFVEGLPLHKGNNRAL